MKKNILALILALALCLGLTACAGKTETTTLKVAASSTPHAEILAQAGAIIMLSNEKNRGKLAYFMAIDHAEYLKPILPGDQLILEVDIPETKSKFGKGEGFISVDGERIANMNLMFAIVDP